MSQPPSMPSPPPGAVHPNTGALPTQSSGGRGKGKLIAVIITVVALVVGIGGGWWLLSNDRGTAASIDDAKSTDDDRDRGENLEHDESDTEEDNFVEVPKAGILHPGKNGWSTSIDDAIDHGYESWYEAPSPFNIESDFGVVVTSIIDEPDVGVTLGDQAEQASEEFIHDFLPDADVEVAFQLDGSLDDHDIYWSSYDFYESKDPEAREMYAKAIHIDMGDEIVGVMGLTPWGSGQIWFHVSQIIDDVEIIHD